MARYEYKTRQQSNIPLGETFNMAVRAPAVANRIFNTLGDAQSYVDDELSNATAGIRITVINDSIPSNNGLYYVKSLSYSDGGVKVSGVLEKVGSNTEGLFVGDAVSRTGSSFSAANARDNDLYLNKITLDLFRKDPISQEWVYVCNIFPNSMDYGKCYYKLSRDGESHPEFDINTWTTVMPKVSDLPADDRDGQWFLWTRLYVEGEVGELHAKYTCSLIHSSLNMGTFSFN